MTTPIPAGAGPDPAGIPEGNLLLETTDLSKDFGGLKALSGGEAQRVAMARALALAPEVLLLDEPLANIDRETTAVLEAVIASLPAHGTTVVLTTHDPGQPARLGGASIVLDCGRIVPSSP